MKFAGDIVARESTSGALIIYNGSTVAWKSKRKSLVEIYTEEAEYIAVKAGIGSIQALIGLVVRT